MIIIIIIIIIMENVALPGQKYHAKGRRKETKIQKFMYRDTTSVEHEMCDRTVNNCSHRNGNNRLKTPRKTFKIFSTKDSCTCNMTHNTESTAA
jgi:hypothetical protein